MKEKKTLNLLCIATIILLTSTLPKISFSQQKAKGEKQISGEKGEKPDSQQEKKKKPGEEKSQESKTNEETPEQKAQQIHEKAVTLYKEEKYEEALTLFIEFNKLKPNPVTVFNIARCYDKTGKLDKAYEYYKKYIETKDSHKVKEAQEAISRIEKLPVKLIIKTDPKDSEVFVDGKAVERKEKYFVLELNGGQHSLLVRKEGYRAEERELDLRYGTETQIEISLIRENASIKEKQLSAKGNIKIPLSVNIGLGATVSTSSIVTSYMDIIVGLAWRIKDFSAGIAFDNMFFSDSYLLGAYPMGSYTLQTIKNLSFSFSAGFGIAYLYSKEKAFDSKGNILVEKGNMWDLIIHVDARARYKLGPIILQAIPLHIDILPGAGSIIPAPLAQFAFLAGVAYDF